MALKAPRASNHLAEYQIIMQAIETPTIALAQMKNELNLGCCPSTISSRLKDSKLVCRVARIKEQLSAMHKARRLQFAQDRQNFAHWHRTVFVDEATFETGQQYRRLIRRPIGLAFDDRYILEKKQSGRQSVPAFGILSRREVGPLIRIEGRFNGERYRDLLDEYVLPYIEDNFGDHFYYYQDNSPIHTCREVRWWFEQNVPEFQMIKPPPKSFDINPIENCWAVAKVNLAKNGIFDDQDDLWIGLSDAWIELQQNLPFAQHLVDSLPRRLDAIIENNGSHTKY